tara:strand:- start:1064 stop:1960 length:897 start_codon:yes stop_codon:yes gene_type:complete
MKVAFAMIVFEGDFVLRQCLEQIYPHASQILIAEGPVTYWQGKGRTTSTDLTNTILEQFPDPEKKIKIVHGQFKGKDEQCNAYMQHLCPETDFLWMVDSDEIYKTQDIEATFNFLKEVSPTSVGIRSCSFFGGFDNHLTGFEQNVDNFLRIFKVTPGSTWVTHRPPTMGHPKDIEKKHINSEFFLALTGVQIYHYSYTFPKQVYNKIGYYKAKVSRDNCIDGYFDKIYMPWVTAATKKERKEIEEKYNGVHEFKPEIRGSCFTIPFKGSHPQSIIKDLEVLQGRFEKEAEEMLQWTRE